MNQSSNSRRDTRRGSYAKGLAKREEILTQALEVIGRFGVQGASVKEIADAVGLSPAGVLHHFDSKEELFTEVLRKRDEMDTQQALGTGGLVPGVSENGSGVQDLDAQRAREQFLRLLQKNASIPGMLHLFSQLAVDAVDPKHPAHEFFVERNQKFQTLFAAILADHQSRGQGANIDPLVAARLLQAVADGLQLQAMLDPDLDMAEITDAFFELVL